MDIWFTIIIALASLFIGFIGGIYLPHRFRSDDKKPILSTGPFQEQFNLFEITNHGGDLLDLSVEIEWIQNGKIEKRTLSRFLNSTDDSLRDRYHMPGALKKGETKKATECPVYSDDGNVQVRIKGKDTDGTDFSKHLILKNRKNGQK